MSCNFDKFELEEKLLLVCLYNFELGSKTTPSLFIYIYFELGAKLLWVGAKWLGGETTAIHSTFYPNNLEGRTTDALFSEKSTKGKFCHLFTAILGTFSTMKINLTLRTDHQWNSPSWGKHIVEPTAIMQYPHLFSKMIRLLV